MNIDALKDLLANSAPQLIEVPKHGLRSSDIYKQVRQSPRSYSDSVSMPGASGKSTPARKSRSSSTRMRRAIIRMAISHPPPRLWASCR